MTLDHNNLVGLYMIPPSHNYVQVYDRLFAPLFSRDIAPAARVAAHHFLHVAPSGLLKLLVRFIHLSTNLMGTMRQWVTGHQQCRLFL